MNLIKADDNYCIVRIAPSPTGIKTDSFSLIKEESIFSRPRTTSNPGKGNVPNPDEMFSPNQCVSNKGS